MKIKISNAILYSQLSPIAKFVYIGLRHHNTLIPTYAQKAEINHQVMYLPYSTDYLTCLFLSDESKTLFKKMRPKILEGIKELQENNLLTIKHTMQDKLLYMNTTPIYINYAQGNWTEIETDVINEIIKSYSEQSNNTTSIIKIIVYYCTIVATINTTTKYGFTSIAKFKEYTSIAPNTIMAFSDYLNDNNFICLVKNNTHYLCRNNKIHSEGNKYYLPQHKDIAMENIKRRQLKKEEQQETNDFIRFTNSFYG